MFILLRVQEYAFLIDVLGHIEQSLMCILFTCALIYLIMQSSIPFSL